MDKNKPDYFKEMEKLFGCAVELPPPEGVYIGEAVTDSPLTVIEFASKKGRPCVQVKLGEGGQRRVVKYTSLRKEETEYD